jgi:hypothetical protein
LKFLLAMASLVAAAPALAQSDAFPFGDPKVGKSLLEAKCSGCHIARFGGDGSRMFTRPERKASSTASVLAWVQRCNTNIKTGLSTEEEQSVAAFLNDAYYQFK